CDGRYATPTAAALASPNDSAWPGRLVHAHEPGIACPDSRRVWIAGVLGRVSCGHIRRVAAAEESCGCGIARLADRALSRDHGMGGAVCGDAAAASKHLLPCHRGGRRQALR